MSSNKIQNTLKKGVLNNKAYTLIPIDCDIKINQNESPFDVPGELKEEIIERLKDKKWNVYPDFTPQDLYDKMAAYLGITSGNLLMGNGSNEMVFTIMAATVEEGKKVIIPEPTFTVYRLIASNLNGTIEAVPLTKDLGYDVDEMARLAAAPGSVTIVVNPNNPTGSVIKRDDIIKILDSSNGLVVVDEAYIHFGGESVIDLIDEYENLIVLRTFSKAFGLAGLRIGMMIANAPLITELSKVKLPYNMNIITLNTLDVMLDHIPVIEEHTQKILKNKDILYDFLSKIKEMEVFSSEANFYLVRVADSATLLQQLIGENILVRDVSAYPMLNNCLRISVGNEEENNALMAALGKIYR